MQKQTPYTSRYLGATYFYTYYFILWHYFFPFPVLASIKNIPTLLSATSLHRTTSILDLSSMYSKSKSLLIKSPRATTSRAGVVTFCLQSGPILGLPYLTRMLLHSQMVKLRHWSDLVLPFYQLHLDITFYQSQQKVASTF